LRKGEQEMSNLFTKDTFDFLIENKLQNDKEWFNENKERYTEYVLKPLVALAERLAPVLKGIDDKIMCSPKVGGAISRIWRDTRFSKDKALFRDAMWLSFLRKKGENLPEFFFMISPAGFMYGAGYYMTTAESMKSIREMILAEFEIADQVRNDDGKDDAQRADTPYNTKISFQEALRVFESQKTFKMDGDMYKKSKFPDAQERIRNWLDRKTICFICESEDFDVLYSDKLADIVAEGFKTLAPIYNFLMRAEEEK